MKAIVTGGTGCVGYHVVLKLLEEGWEVIVFHRETSNVSMFDSRVTLVKVNLYDLNSTLNSVPSGVDAIFHLAANVAHHTDPNQWKDNVLVTKNLTEAAIQKKVTRFIFTSTAAARFARDTSDPKKLAREIPSGYARTKRLAEIVVLDAAERGLDIVILQPTIVLGEFDFHRNYSQLFEKNILTLIRASLPGRLEFADAKKIAKAHVNAYHKGERNCFYVLGGEYLSWFELQRVIASTHGEKPPLFTLPNWFLHVIAIMHGIGYKLFGAHPQMTKDLIWLLGDEDPVQQPESRKAKIDLDYSGADTDIKEVCFRMHSWIQSQK